MELPVGGREDCPHSNGQPDKRCRAYPGQKGRTRTLEGIAIRFPRASSANVSVTPCALPAIVHTVASFTGERTLHQRTRT
jgi:hypothetical protein